MLTATRPEELFKLDTETAVTTQYRKLASQHHPDKGGAAADFQLVKKLYDAAIEKIRNKELWDDGRVLRYPGSAEIFSYITRDIEVAQTRYYGSSSVLYVLRDKDLLPLAFDASRLLATVRWPANISAGVLPICRASQFGIEADHGEFTVPLLDIVGSGVEPVHAAWMLSRVMNMWCMLSHAGLMHGALDRENLFVDTDSHSLYLFGGWQYARRVGERLVALPESTARLLPATILTEKVACDAINSILIQKFAVDIFGGKSVAHLRALKYVPAVIADFIASGIVRRDPIAVYQRWEKVLVAGFGPRKFVKFTRS